MAGGSVGGLPAALGGELGLGALLRLLGEGGQGGGGRMNGCGQTPLLRQILRLERVIIEPVSRKCYFV